MTEAKHQIRDFGIDNLRVFLIFCVVFAHFLEIYNVRYGGILYRLIYQFHMPCFFFLNGYFAKDTPSTSGLCKQIIRYILFQTAYLSFTKMFLHADVSLQYTTPFWIMWYSLALILYTVLLPAYHLHTPGKRFAAVIISFLICFFAGFDESVGYYLTLSRAVAFQPYFLLGYCYRKEEAHIYEFFCKQHKFTVFIYFLILLGICAGGLCALDSRFSAEVLYRAVSYSNGFQSFLQRIYVSILGVFWIFFFIMTFRRIFSRRIPVVSRIGANTLPIYLFHGFLIQYFIHHPLPFLNNYFSILLISVLCLLILGSPYLTRLIGLKWGKPSAVERSFHNRA